MQKKILIIGEINNPIANANGICLETLAKDLAANNEVTISTYAFGNSPHSEIIDSVTYKRIKPTLFYRLRELSHMGNKSKTNLILYKLSLIYNKFKRVIFLPLFPISSIGFIVRYYSFLKKIMTEEKFDIILSVYFPIDSVLTGHLLKKKFPNTKHVIYLVDTISNGAKVMGLSRSWTTKRGIKWESIFFERADSILIFEAHMEHYTQDIFSKYLNKIHFTDVPLFNPMLATPGAIDTTTLSLVYSGSLIYGLRSPERIIEIFERPEFINCNVSFYSQGAYDDILKQAEHNTHSRISSNGFVNHKEISEVLRESAILISIGNSHSKMIPSKTFEYISTGKPIIHFYSSDEDTSILHFERYGNCLLVDTRLDLDNNINSVLAFIESELKTIDPRKLISLFEKNTTEYTNSIILK